MSAITLTMIEILDNSIFYGFIKPINVKCFKFNDKYYIDLYQLLKDNVDMKSRSSYSYLERFKINGNIYNIPGIIACYRHYYDLNNTFVCSDFAKCMINIFINDYENQDYMVKDFAISLYKTDCIADLETSDTVIFVDSYNETHPKLINFTHAAIFICDDLYLSKLGNGPICFMTSTEIAQMYKTDTIYKIMRR